MAIHTPGDGCGYTVAVTACALAMAGCATMARPASPALAHIHQVNEALYRGAQPTEEGLRQLRAMGVKTIVSLRAHSPTPRRETRALVESLGMRWVSLPMRMYWRPTDEQVREFLRVVSEPANQPVFIHCQHGEDRTGSLVAIYRVAKQGWAPEDAYAEALALGMSGWNPFTRRMILREARRFLPDLASTR